MSLHLSWKSFKQGHAMARFVSGKHSLARMGWEELNYPSEPNVEAGAAPLRRGPRLPETHRWRVDCCHSGVPVAARGRESMYLGRALGHPRRRISTGGHGWNQIYFPQGPK